MDVNVSKLWVIVEDWEVRCAVVHGLQRVINNVATGEGKGYPLQYAGPGEFHGLYSPWGHKESDMTEQLSLHFTYQLKNNSKNSDS